MPVDRNADGVVKFTARHRVCPLPDFPGLDTLMQTRNTLRARGLIGVTPAGTGYGNVSMRAGPDNRFIISGTGTGATNRLGPDGYCLVTACSVAGNCLLSEGPVPASSESLTHFAVYAARPDAGCVIHVHSRALFAALPALGCPSTSPAAAYGSQELALEVSRVVTAMPSSGMVILTGHQDGILAFGPGCSDALQALLARHTELE